jgi:RTX calcium-binding nonapeptide repeat (4 copies)
VRRRGFLGAAVGSAIATLFFAGSAQAALTSDFDNGTLRFFSNAASETNNASFSFDNDEGSFIVQDPSAGAVPGVCNVDGDTIVLNDCPGLTGTPRTLFFDLGGGSDSLNVGDSQLLLFPFNFRASMGAGADALIALIPFDATMGPGNDTALTVFFRNRLQGGPGDDVLEAGGGDDVVSGDAGDDRIWGGLREDDPNFDPGDGSDKLLGGSGRDQIHAKDRTKDRKLDCGGGNDKLRRDSFDPRPKSC